MTESECQERLQSLRSTNELYERYVNSPSGNFFKCPVMLGFIKNNLEMICALESAMYLGELEDSFSR